MSRYLCHKKIINPYLVTGKSSRVIEDLSILTTYLADNFRSSLSICYQKTTLTTSKMKIKNEVIVQTKSEILSKRELELLFLVASEYTTPEIAKKLFISKGTVDTHRNNILQKLKVKNTAGMIRRAFELGLLKIEDDKSILTAV